MRGTVVWLLVLALPFLVLATPAHAQSTTTYNASGAYAMTSFNTNNNLTVNLFVGQGCTAPPCTPSNSTGTFIVYFAFPTVPDPNGPNYVTEGDGYIPNSAFVSNNTQHMSVNVDTGQVSGFTAESCSFVNGSFNCVPGQLGVIQTDWEQTQQISSSNKSDSTTTNGPFTVKTHDDSSSNSGAATGTFLGGTFSSSTQTSMGTNNSHTTSITRPQ
jgi:hypothetical protein